MGSDPHSRLSSELSQANRLGLYEQAKNARELMLRVTKFINDSSELTRMGHLGEKGEEVLLWSRFGTHWTVNSWLCLGSGLYCAAVVRERGKAFTIPKPTAVSRRETSYLRDRGSRSKTSRAAVNELCHAFSSAVIIRVAASIAGMAGRGFTGGG